MCRWSLVVVRRRLSLVVECCLLVVACLLLVVGVVFAVVDGWLWVRVCKLVDVVDC